MNDLTTSNQKSFIPSPTSFEEAWRLAEVLANSDMVPECFKGKPENCLIALQWGADLGIPGMQALQNIAVINKRPSIWGDAAKALVIGRPDCEDIIETFEGSGDNVTAVCVVKRKGKSPVTAKFSTMDAKIAGLLDKPGPWRQYKNRMLQMRARSFALRDAFPDALRGLSIAEEAQDMPIEKDITPIQNDVAQNIKHVSLDDVLADILTMDIADFKTIDPDPYTEQERVIIRKAMTARKKAMEAEKKQTKWSNAIDQCNDIGELTALLADMPGDVQIILDEKIDSKFDELNEGEQQ